MDVLPTLERRAPTQRHRMSPSPREDEAPRIMFPFRNEKTKVPRLGTFEVCVRSMHGRTCRNMPKVPMERIIALKQKRACLTSQSLSQSLARRTPHGRTIGLRGLPLSLIQMGMGRYSFWIHTLSPPPDFGLTLSVVSARRPRHAGLCPRESPRNRILEK